MFAIILGMLTVLCGVLFFRLHAFLALFFGALVVAALSIPGDIAKSVLHDSTAQVVVVSPTELELSHVGKNFDAKTGIDAKPGIFDLVADVPGEGKEKLEVWVHEFKKTTSGLTAELSKPIKHNVDWEAHLQSQAKIKEAANLAKSSAINRVASALGTTFGKIGILIAMASIIGQCLLSSGAAERIVKTIRGAMGEKGTAPALVISSFVLAIPVFFDTVFFLMLPIAKAMARRSGRDYLKYVLSIIVGGTLAHSLVPPTPGPLFVATELNVSIGAMVIGGIGVGIWGVIAGYFYMLWANRTWQIPLRFSGDEEDSSGESEPINDDQLPNFLVSILPVFVPIFLLALKTISQTWELTELEVAKDAISFLGDKNIAISIGAILALITMLLKPNATWGSLGHAVQKALSEGGVVVLITCAGGAFGEMIRQTNVGATIADSLPTSVGGIGLLVTAFLITMIIRVIQGSATVAMITAIGIVVPVANQIGLPFHPVYLALAIGCGSKPLPWMNDSGFWVISRMSGLTEKETLKTFSVLLTIMGLVSFLATVLCAMLFPGI